jgi:hypothetical protein
VINSLNRQKNCLENILKVCAGIPLETNMLLERRIAGVEGLEETGRLDDTNEEGLDKVKSKSENTSNSVNYDLTVLNQSKKNCK